MDDNRKYYWLKLKKDFFQRHDIRIIENMPNGKDYVLFYLKLLCESTSHDGKLRFSDMIPYNEQMLSTITNTNVDIVKQAIDILKGLKMVEILDDGTIYMDEVNVMVGYETKWAEKKRIYRANTVKQIDAKEDKVRTKKDKVRQEKELEIELEIDKDKKNKRIYGAYKNVRLTNDEVLKLKNQYGEDLTNKAITYLDEYIEMKGTKYKSHYLVMKKWVYKALAEKPSKKAEKVTNNPFLEKLISEGANNE